MINNAQLDNEKTSYSYQVDLYKDDLEELEENYNRVHKDYKDKSRVYIFIGFKDMLFIVISYLFIQLYDQLSRDYKRLQDDQDYLKECLRQRDELIEVNFTFNI